MLVTNRFQPSLGRVAEELATRRGGEGSSSELVEPIELFPSPKSRSSTSTLPREGENRGCHTLSRERVQ